MWAVAMGQPMKATLCLRRADGIVQWLGLGERGAMAQPVEDLGDSGVGTVIASGVGREAGSCERG